MTGTVFILGATGRFGRAATLAFARAGWTVRAASRTGGGNPNLPVQGVTCDAYNKDDLIKAVQGADVIVNAVHPLYFEWEEKQPLLTENIIAAARAAGATVMIPSNVYPFGEATPEVLREGNPPIPSTRKGAVRVTMEAAFEEVAKDGLQTIVLRGGTISSALSQAIGLTVISPTRRIKGCSPIPVRWIVCTRGPIFPTWPVRWLILLRSVPTCLHTRHWGLRDTASQGRS